MCTPYPIEPATSFDATPEMIIDTEPIPAPEPLPEPVAVVPTVVAYTPEPASYASPATAVPMTGNSEAAVLNRIAARANELNFDRIGRATAAEADDLKDIVGIGPFLERKLHSLGILYLFGRYPTLRKKILIRPTRSSSFFPVVLSATTGLTRRVCSTSGNTRVNRCSTRPENSRYLATIFVWECCSGLMYYPMYSSRTGHAVHIRCIADYTKSRHAARASKNACES